MQADFWHTRWANNQIGFHLDEINPYLMRHLSRLRLQAGERILVPLCGKTLDLAWLAAQGLEVLGVELSEKAVSDFFEEHDLRPEIDQLGGFRRYRVAGITLLQGDFFPCGAGRRTPLKMDGAPRGAPSIFSGVRRPAPQGCSGRPGRAAWSGRRTSRSRAPGCRRGP